MPALNEEEIELYLEKNPNWVIKDGKFIERTYKFNKYLEGIQFVSEVGVVADEMKHHPSIQIDYGKVIVSLTSHDVGGLSNRDFESAQRYDQLYEKRK